MAATRAPVMQSMRLDEDAQYDALTPIPMDKPDFPPGLRFTLTAAEFEKLGLDPSVAERGAIFHGHFMARIMFVSHTEDASGKNCRIEAQIEDLCLDCEDEENY